MRIVANGFLFLAVMVWSACSQNKSKQTVGTTTDQPEQKNAATTTATPLNGKPASKQDSLAYRYIYLDTRRNDCQNCDYIAIKYPVLANKPALSDSIQHVLFNYISAPYKKHVDFESFFKKNMPVDSANVDTTKRQPQTAEYAIEIERQDNHLAVIDFNTAYTGGAHPNSSMFYLNWDIKKDKSIELDSLFVNNYADKLTAIAEPIFRKEEGLGVNDNMENYFFENGFSLNDNFRIMPEGLSFFYNTYEIKPYSEGTTELLIPYSSIKNLLRPNTVISQYIQ